MTLISTFKKIIKRQKEIGYSFPDSLNHPANIKQIEKIENDLGFRFSNDLKKIYLFANGCKVRTSIEEEDCLIPGYRFLSLEEAGKYYEDNIQNKYVFDELFVHWETEKKPGVYLFPILADGIQCYWVDLNEASENYGKLYCAIKNGESPEYEFISLSVLFKIILKCYSETIFFLKDISFSDSSCQVLSCDFVRYGELCQKLNPDIQYWKIATETWRQYLNE